MGQGEPPHKFFTLANHSGINLLFIFAINQLNKFYHYERKENTCPH